MDNVKEKDKNKDVDDIKDDVEISDDQLNNEDTPGNNNNNDQIINEEVPDDNPKEPNKNLLEPDKPVPGIDQEKQDVQDDEHFADNEYESDDNDEYESDNDVIQEINDIMNPTLKDIFSKTTKKLNHNTKVIEDATEINDVLDMDTVVSMHQQNDFEPAQSTSSSTTANRLHLAMMSDSILRMAETTGIIDMGPIHTQQENDQQTGQQTGQQNDLQVGYVTTEYTNRPPTDITTLNKNILEKMKPTQKEIIQQRNEQRLKEKIRVENLRIWSDYDIKLYQNGDSISDVYFKIMEHRADPKDIKLVSEYLDVIRFIHSEDKFSYKIWDDVKRIRSQYEFQLKQEPHIKHFVNLRESMVRGIDYEKVTQRIGKDEVQRLRRSAASSTINVLSAKVENLPKYDNEVKTALTSRLDKLKADIKDYKEKNIKGHQRKKKHKKKHDKKPKKKKQWGKTEQEVQDMMENYEQQQSIRSNAWSIGAVARPVKPTLPTEPKIVKVGNSNVHKFEYPDNYGSGKFVKQSGSNVFSMKHDPGKGSAGFNVRNIKPDENSKKKPSSKKPFKPAKGSKSFLYKKGKK